MSEKEYYVSRMEHLHMDERVKTKMLERTRSAKRERMKIYQKTGIAAAVFAALALFVIPSPVRTKAQEYCRLAVYHINDFLYGAHEDVADYTTDPVQTDKDGNLALQLNEVLVDGDHMIFNYTVTCDDPVFYFKEGPAGGTYEGYYDIVMEQITINGKTKKYKIENPENNLAGFVSESTDHYSYPIEDEWCMHEFADILKSDPNEPLKVQMDVAAINPDDDVRHFSFAFDITNRDLQFETKEIPIDHQVQIDDVALTLDKMVINRNSQKVYFYIDGVEDFGYRMQNNDRRYEFGISGTDDSGNQVGGAVAEIMDGYGYFDLKSGEERIALNPDVKYYDFQIDYTWYDTSKDVVQDGSGIGDEESVYYGVDGTLGDVFRVNCK